MNNCVDFGTCDKRMAITPHVFRGQAWWKIARAGSDDAERWVRLFSDRAFKHLLSSYAYMDGDGCINSCRPREARHVTPVAIRRDYTLSGLSDEEASTRGVQQRSHASGACWWCAVCFVVFFCPQVRSFFLDKFPAELAEMCKGVLNDGARAERLRRHLYHAYAFGDRPGQDPALDGQNGFSQLSILVARFDIPMVRLLAPSMFEITDDVVDQAGVSWSIRRTFKAGEPALLVIRAFRTKYTPPRRVVWKGRRFRLASLLIGSEWCTHQIAASSCGLRVRRWAVADSDAAQHGIGPVFWSLRKKKDETPEQLRDRWREMWHNLVPVTLFGNRQVCDMNPVNRCPHELVKYAGCKGVGAKPGVVNTDYIYISLQ